MGRFIIVLDGRTYAPLEDIHALKRAFIAAARTGGDFVTFHTVARRIEVFVTSALVIRFEELDA